MIEVSPETACILYLAASIMAVIGIWLYQHKSSKKKEIVTFKTKHITCDFCTASYLDDAAKTYTRCPACQSLNKTTKASK